MALSVGISYLTRGVCERRNDVSVGSCGSERGREREREREREGERGRERGRGREKERGREEEKERERGREKERDGNNGGKCDERVCGRG